MHTGSRGQGSRGRKDHGVGSPDHFSRHAKQNGNEMKQVMNHNKDNGLLNMIRRTDTMIFLSAIGLCWKMYHQAGTTLMS